MQSCQGAIDRGHIHLHDVLPFAAVRLVDRPLDMGDRVIQGQDVGEREEAGLQDGVDASAQSQFAGCQRRVDHVEFEFLVDDLLLHRARQAVEHLVRAIRRVKQKCGARRRHPQDIQTFQELELVAGHEVGPRNQIGCTDRLATEA